MGLRGRRAESLGDGKSRTDGKVERVPLCFHRAIIKLGLFLGVYDDNPSLSSSTSFIFVFSHLSFLHPPSFFFPLFFSDVGYACVYTTRKKKRDKSQGRRNRKKIVGGRGVEKRRRSVRRDSQGKMVSETGESWCKNRAPQCQVSKFPAVTGYTGREARHRC